MYIYIYIYMCAYLQVGKRIGSQPYIVLHADSMTDIHIDRKMLYSHFDVTDELLSILTHLFSRFEHMPDSRKSFISPFIITIIVA